MVRFFRQRNLRIAYAITTSRAIFWAALFVYGPIYVVESGLPAWVAGVFLSAASGMLFISPMVRVAADRLGTRAVIIGALGVMSASMVALAIIGDARQLGLVFWLTGALGGAAVDMLGNIPFMRLVKPRERVAMTAIFTTWRETSFLLAPVIAAIALGLGSFWLLYLVIAVLLASAAIATSFLPRRL
jgi:MFS transporter, ACDE family, multidrug resistance protein